ncbi:MAG TPA: 1-(5-phosphoribosyl)-5-[(5-phosphoribosylamino)methylideneamino]imidazole-4-carboxamide isomerase [Ktedonobacterales bacterium]|nr:1-(5-phosphoribosyl)-5-[(5-phosphoribosylamino)methylideneamino]imidazole-4-carboxamide isomerase [Ktedonobacterales bacterium]
MTALTLYPAIDLLGGRCVRLRQGDYDQVSVYDEDPVAVARRWADAGAAWLHVVDLEGARSGRPAHLPTLGAICRATSLAVQYGGGLRTMDDIKAALAAGASRVILGTAAAREPEFVAGCLEMWDPANIAVSVDARGGRAAVAGWRETTAEPALDLARRMSDAGVATLILTNVERDGTLAGVDAAPLAAVRAAVAPEVALIAAGGITTLEDLRRLAAVGIGGAVLGSALYTGALDFATALAAARELRVASGEGGAPC